MGNQQLTENSNFVMKESVFLDLFIAGFFYCMVICAVVYDSNVDASKVPLYYKALLLGLVPAIYFTIKAIINPLALTVNKNGIYIHKIYVTDWKHFKSASVIQLPLAAGGYTDNFVLIVEYYKDNEDGFFERKLTLTDTQNKSGEEISAAIDFFNSLPK